MALCILCLTVSGCANIKIASNLGDDILLTVNDEECTLAEAVFRLMEVMQEYDTGDGESLWDREIGDTTLDEYIKQGVLDDMKKYTSSVIIADQMAITLTQDEISALTDEANAAYAGISTVYDTEAYGITQDTVISLYKKQAIYNKLYDQLSDDLESQISESDTKVICVNYVALPADTSLNSAEELRKEILAGTDFEEACEAAGYEPVMDQVLKKGDMSSAFETVAYALTDGELSEIVETSSAMYIIECVEDYMIAESVANNNEVLAEAREEAFNDTYLEFAQEAELRVNSEEWESVNVKDF